MTFDSLQGFAKLMRLNKPIGIFLLLWPTLWALWLAANNHPDVYTLIIFICGVVVMRSAGCVINDYADQHFDGNVERTRDRPLITGEVTPRAALILFGILIFCALLLVLQLNWLTILLAFVGAALAIIYPYLKRFTHLPQVGLGAAFAWSVPMAFAAVNHTVPLKSWVVFLAAALWPVIYDTMYAMVDRGDDIKIGIKSTAILFGKYTPRMVAILQILFMLLLAMIGVLFHLSWAYYVTLWIVVALLVNQHGLISSHSRDNYFKAFQNNLWLGMVIFIAIVVGKVI